MALLRTETRMSGILKLCMTLYFCQCSIKNCNVGVDSATLVWYIPLENFRVALSILRECYVHGCGCRCRCGCGGGAHAILLMHTAKGMRFLSINICQGVLADFRK